MFSVGYLKDLATSCPQGVRLLGVDLGTRTIGLSVCDAGQGIATPLLTIERGKFAADAAALGNVIKEFDVGGMVFGWPLNMDGTEGASCERVRSFIDELKNHPQALGMKQGISMWIALFDERLSTSTVDDFLVETVDMSRTKRKQVIDKLAAQVILQGALDYMKENA